MTQTPEPELSPAEARLLAGLRDALDVDAPPAGLVERAEGLVAYFELDSDLAALLDEPAPELAGVRGPAGTDDRLTFETADGSLSVEVVLSRERLSGQVLAGDGVQVVLETLAGAQLTAAVDPLGRFRFDDPPAGPARLCWAPARPTSSPEPATPAATKPSPPTEAPVTTDWFLL